MYKTERLKAFSSNLPFLVSVNLAISTILVFSGIYDVIDESKLIWLVCIYAVSAVRLVIHFRVDDTYHKKLDLHFIGVILAGVAWASYPYLFHQTFTLREQFVTIIIFCGMSGGSASLLAADLRSAFAFTSITVFPYSAVLLTSNNFDESIIGIMSLGYGAALCLGSKRTHAFIISSIKNQVKAEKLVINLAHEVEQRTAKISSLEQRDLLTGLYNRDSFTNKVDIIRHSHTKRARFQDLFLHVDIDNFHIINNNYGHEIGDRVLNEIGQRLHSIDKFYSSISARWGNDEFLIYARAKVSCNIEDFINTLASRLEEKIQIDNIVVSPSFHMGYHLGEEEISVLQGEKNAYLALIEGKRSNLKQCKFNEEIKRCHARDTYLIAAMKIALLDEAFHMNFQPIVDIKTNQIHSFEALVRWQWNNEFISPAEFIPLAEQHGLIVDLGKLVLKMSVEALAEANDRNPDISMSVNVSVIQFEDDSFLDYLAFLIEQYSITPHSIHLEITETAMISNLTKLTRSIKRAKEIGVMISVDDFGTGFSSISVLKNLSIDYIKIDKSYIDNICTDDKDLSIVSAVTRMTHAINAMVIAEGVEDNDQREILHRHDIDFYQGYLFSKPVSRDNMLTLL